MTLSLCSQGKSQGQTPASADSQTFADQQKQILAQAAARKPATEISKVTDVSLNLAKQLEAASSPSLKPKAKAFREELEKVTGELNKWAEQIRALRENKQPITAANAPKYPTVFTPTMMDLVQRSSGPGASTPTPPAGTSQSANDKQQDEQMKTLMTLAGAALCVYQPELCPFVMAFVASMGGSAEEVQSSAQLMRDIESANRNGEFSDDLIERMTKKLNDATGSKIDAETLKRLRQLPELVENGDPSSAPWDKALTQAIVRSDQIWEKISHQFPKWVSDLVPLLLDGKPEEVICRAFVQRDGRGPYYTDDSEKKLVKIAVSWVAARSSASGGATDIQQRYWDNLLGKIGLGDDLNRVDPCPKPQ